MSDLIFRKESKRYPGLFVKKYKKQVFYSNLWHTSDELLEARGHVEDEDGNIVIRPFTKVFNRGENGTEINRDEMVLAIQKINGFMAAATYVPQIDDVVVSTTGSLDSDFVALAEKYIDGKSKSYIRFLAKYTKPMTFLFEICDESDPHIIQEQSGAYLIGARPVSAEDPYFSDKKIESILDYISPYLGAMRPNWKIARFSDIIQETKSCKHEGFVVYGQESKTALKIKSPYYLSMKAIARKKDIMSLNKERVDEEFYGLIDHLMSMGEQFTNMEEQARLDYMRTYLENSND